MIPKINKLKLRKIIDFFQNCERYHSIFFLVFHRRSDSKNTKIVVVVPKKTIKLRVKRTKIKRQIYNLSLPLVKKTPELELVLVVNKKIITASKEAISTDLEIIFSSLIKK